MPAERKKLGLKVWGTRGSIPAPGAQTARFGGHTTCYEVLCGGKDRIVIDAGTGIYPYGVDLVKRLRKKPVGKVHILMTHTHWDHIQGLPLCPLLYREDAEIHFYSHHRRILDVLKMQHHRKMFPVLWQELRAKIVGHHLKFGDGLEFESVSVSTMGLHHPEGSVGYKITRKDRAKRRRKLALLTDNEWLLMAPSKKAQLNAFLEDVPLMFHDGMFIGHEVPLFDEWGHSYLQDLLKMPWVKTAKRSDGRLFVLIHHHPMRTDTQLSWLEKWTRKQVPQIRFKVGKEGTTYWCP